MLALSSVFSRISFIEHLEAVPAGTRSGAYLGLIPRLGLWRYRDRLRRKLPGMFADDIVAVSQKVRDRLISDCGYSARKISVVHNGVAWRDHARDVSAGSVFRQSLSIPADSCLVTILARLEHAKGIDVALAAFALLEKMTAPRMPRLLIAGTGSLEDTLKEQARCLGLDKTVTFAGYLSNPKPALWASDAILFSSRLEGLPLGLLEGMAAGCLPVVTRVSGMPEVVSHPDLGWVIDPDDPDALAAAIHQLACLDDRTIEAFRKRVVAHIGKWFDLSRSQQRLAEQLGL
jgi:glycosyltransferase involved in cell wall biosynthesis